MEPVFWGRQYKQTSADLVLVRIRKKHSLARRDVVSVAGKGHYWIWQSEKASLRLF